jgi:hypothetical protein
MLFRQVQEFFYLLLEGSPLVFTEGLWIQSAQSHCNHRWLEEA